MKAHFFKKAAALLLASALVSGGTPLFQAVSLDNVLTLSASAEEQVPNDEVEFTVPAKNFNDPEELTTLITVSTWADLQAAINNASSTETTSILVSKNENNEPLTPEPEEKGLVIPSNKDINLFLACSLDRGLGNSDPEEDGYVIKNEGVLRVFDYLLDYDLGNNTNNNDVIIFPDRSQNSIKITGGNNNGNGGGICNTGELEIYNINITDNKADVGGGIANIEGSTDYGAYCYIVNSNIERNNAKSASNGLMFSSSSSDGLGGGIYNCINDNGELMIRNSSITDNNSDVRGGGVYTEGEIKVIGDVIIRDNKSNVYTYNFDNNTEELIKTNPSNLCLNTYYSNESHKTKRSLLNGHDLQNGDKKADIGISAPEGFVTTNFNTELNIQDVFTPDDPHTSLELKETDTYVYNNERIKEVYLSYSYFAGASMSCTDGLALNFSIYDHPDFTSNYQVRAYCGGKVVDHETRVEDQTVISVKLPAKMVGETVQLHLYIQGLNFGEYSSEEPLADLSYSAAEYLETIINNNDNKYTNHEVALAKAAYRYGYNSAKLFNYTNVNPAYSESENQNATYAQHLVDIGVLTQDDVNGTTEYPASVSYVSDHKGVPQPINTDLSNMGLKYYGMALVLEDLTSVDIYFRVTDKKANIDHYYSVFQTGSENIENVITSEYGAGGDYSDTSTKPSIKVEEETEDEGDFIHFRLLGFSPEQLCDPQFFFITLTTWNSETNEYEKQNSVLLAIDPAQYVNLALKKGSPELKATAMSLYDYYTASENVLAERQSIGN